VEKTFKYELRSCEVVSKGKIVEDREDAARQHNTKILCWYVNKLRGSSQSGFVPVKDRNGATLRKPLKRYVKQFENEVNRDRVTGNIPS